MNLLEDGLTNYDYGIPRGGGGEPSAGGGSEYRFEYSPRRRG